MFKKNFILLLCIMSLIFSSCCRDCLITNRELSGFNTFKDKNDDIAKINSAWKSAEFVMNLNQGIRTYSISDNNILNSIYSQSVSETYISEGENIWSPVEFEPLENDIVGKSKVIYSNINKKLDIRDVRKISMNLDNGDLYLSEEVFNDSKNTIIIQQNDALNLQSGGYLLVPVSILSDLGKQGWESVKSIPDKFIRENIKKTNNWLIVRTVPGIHINIDSNSGWFLYLKNNLLFVEKYNTLNSEGKRVNTLLNIAVDDLELTIIKKGLSEKILPGKNSFIKQRWSIVEINNEIKNIKEAGLFYRKLELKLKLLINRKDID